MKKLLSVTALIICICCMFVLSVPSSATVLPSGEGTIGAAESTPYAYPNDEPIGDYPNTADTNDINENGDKTVTESGSVSRSVSENSDTAQAQDTDGMNIVMALVWLVIIAAVILLIVALVPKRRGA